MGGGLRIPSLMRLLRLGLLRNCRDLKYECRSGRKFFWRFNRVGFCTEYGDGEGDAADEVQACILRLLIGARM